MTKEEIKNFEDKKVRFVFDETEELRRMDIGYLGLKEGYEKILYRFEIRTLGDLIDNWERLPRLHNMGVVKVRHIRAAFFAYLMEIGAIRDTKLISA